ncbi:MAG: hypothetical protein ACTJGD_01495 [Mesonia hippocampi]
MMKFLIKVVMVIDEEKHWIKEFPYAQVALLNWVSKTLKIAEKVINLF